MTTTTHDDRVLGGTPFTQTLSNLTAGLAQRFARFRAHRATLNELAQLSDRDLADIGLHRANIGTVAREASYEA